MIYTTEELITKMAEIGYHYEEAVSSEDFILFTFDGWGRITFTRWDELENWYNEVAD